MMIMYYRADTDYNRDTLRARISDLVSRLIEAVEYMTSEAELVEEEHTPTNASEIIDSYTLFEYEVEKKYRSVKDRCRVLVHKITNRLMITLTLLLRNLM